MFTNATLSALLSLAAAVFWSVSPVLMASAGRKIGAYNTNILRLLIASIIYLILFAFCHFVLRLPGMIPTKWQFGWLIASGLSGVAVGDYFFFESMVTIGPRRALQISTLTPVVSVAAEWVLFGQTLQWPQFIGIALVIASLAYATYLEGKAMPATIDAPVPKMAWGTLCAFLSAASIGVAYTLIPLATKDTRVEVNPLSISLIRMSFSALVLWMVPFFQGRTLSTFRLLGSGRAIHLILLGTLIGSVGGQYCLVSALALKDASAGVVATLSTLSPIFILPISLLHHRERIPTGAILATISAVIGVTIIFLTQAPRP